MTDRNSMEVYLELSNQRYGDLTPKEQKVVRIGSVVATYQTEMEKHRTSGMMEEYTIAEDNVLIFLSQLEIAVTEI